MKKNIFLLAFFLPFSMFAYYGDVSKFSINEDVISLNAPEEASQAWLSTESGVSKNAIWSSIISLSFPPTSSNYLRWFIMADSVNVNSSSNAYYLNFGGTSRTIEFYQRKDGKSSLVYRADEKILNNSKNNIEISIKRIETDDWEVSYVLNDTLSQEFTFFNAEINYSAYSGWHCVYTKTRSKAFSFKNTYISGQEQSVPRMPIESELLINEILFNPIGDGVDFIEIYNASDTVFDLSLCKLGNKKQTYSLPYYLLYPDSCVAITKDTIILCEQYNCRNRFNLLQVEKMLPMPNDSGFIRLICDTTLIDTLFYRESMHHVFLNNVEGLSLERSPNGEWNSASTILRATPGYENSRNTEDLEDTAEVESEDDFYLLSPTISACNPHLPENLVLHYRLHDSSMVSIKIYSLGGYSVFTLLESELLHGEGKLYWDGRDENSKILPIGIYVVVVEIYENDGDFIIKKLPVAITP